jgi:hypothetical protein
VCPFALGLRRSSPHHSSTISNEAAFGTDYFTRTAVAKSNIFVNAPIEAKYFYQDLDASGARLNGARRYTVTFPIDLGTKNKDLRHGPDGALTIYAQADQPPPDQRSNWLPAPAGKDFSLYLRAYWPKVAVTDGSWTPPGVQPVK